MKKILDKPILISLKLDKVFIQVGETSIEANAATISATGIGIIVIRGVIVILHTYRRLEHRCYADGCGS